MEQFSSNSFYLILSGYLSAVVLFVWFDNRRLRKTLKVKESENQRRTYEINILKEIGERAGHSVNVETGLDVVTSSLGKVVRCSTASYLLLAASGQKIKFRCHLEESVSREFIESVKKRSVSALALLLGSGVDPAAIEEHVSGKITDESNENPAHSFFCVPIMVNDQIVGIFNVSSDKPGMYRDDEINLLHSILNYAKWH